MTLQTRKPTGKPSWPIMLLAGREKAGKSWAAISASSSNLIGRTLYIGVGEDDPDEYSLIPGADFEIVEHDGTYPGILAAVRDAVAEPAGELPTLIILDSATRLWNLIGDNMQAVANRRANGKRSQASGDYTISTDLWNVAAAQWADVMDALREHHGPSIITARLDPVTVMKDGQPTKDKEWKVQAHKSLVFDATAIIEMRARGEFLITGVKSARVQLDKARPFPKFTVDTLWTDLGLADGTSERSHATIQSDQSGAEPARSQGARPPRQRGDGAWIVAVEKIKAAQSLADLKSTWDALGPDVKARPEVIAAKDFRKEALSEPTADAWAATGKPAAFECISCGEVRATVEDGLCAMCEAEAEAAAGGGDV